MIKRVDARIFCFLTIMLMLFLFPAAAGCETLTTLFSSTTTGCGNMFNMTVLSDQDIVITAFDINLYSSKTEVPISVYYREGPYGEYDSTSQYINYPIDASAWTLLETVYVTVKGIDQPTHVPVNDIRLTAGTTYSFYLTLSEFSGEALFCYTDGTDDFYEAKYLIYSLYGNYTYADSNLSISCGLGNGWPQFDYYYDNRIWNGTVYYDIYIPESDDEDILDITVPQTGDTHGHTLWLAAAASILSGCALLWLLRRRFKNHTRD